MKIELTILISIVSCLSGIFLGFSNYLRNSKNDEKQAVTEMIKVTSKLDIVLKAISDDIAEIKSELKDVKTGLGDTVKRVASIEFNVKFLQDKIKELEGNLDKYEKSCKDCRRTNDLKEV